jgi:ATP-binding cassette subfamily F protein uup
MTAPNVLLLDEPTNDLDIQTLIALEEYLDDFGGALIAVSHDRYFLDRVVNSVFRMEGDGSVKEYPGNYSAYLEFRERDEAALDSGGSTNIVEQPAPRNAKEQEGPRKLSFKERRELEELESKVEAEEARRVAIEVELGVHASDAAKVHALFVEQQELSQQLERDLERWTELAERAEL